MNNTKRNKAIRRVENAATDLIAQAEVVNISDTEWARQSRRDSLLEKARIYAKAVDQLAKTAA